MTIELDIEETIELISMHGASIMNAGCDCCGQPVKEKMLLKLERMRELILTLPDHVTEIEYEPEERTEH